MNIIALQTLISILDTGSLVKASRQLNVTQSTVTARLQQLESECSQVLIHRQKSGVIATPAGRKMLHYAKTMVGLWKQAKLEVSRPTIAESFCNFVCHADLWKGIGDSVFDSLNSYYPNMTFSIKRGSQAEIEQWAQHNMVDIVITYHPNNGENQSAKILLTEMLILCGTKPNIPIRGSGSYVFVEHGQEFNYHHATFYADTDVARISFDSYHWALDYLMYYQGSAYLPERLATSYIANGTLYELTKAPKFERNVYIETNDLSVGKWSWEIPVLSQH